MGIMIQKDEVGVKFFSNKNDVEPIAVIYSGGKVGIISNDMITSRQQAYQMSQAMLIMGVFIQCVSATEAESKKKAFPVVFFNNFIDTDNNREQKYSAKQVLTNIVSNKVVTVNKKERLKYQFVDFQFKDGKLFVNYNPVIW